MRSGRGRLMYVLHSLLAILMWFLSLILLCEESNFCLRAGLWIDNEDRRVPLKWAKDDWDFYYLEAWIHSNASCYPRIRAIWRLLCLNQGLILWFKSKWASPIDHFEYSLFSASNPCSSRGMLSAYGTSKAALNYFAKAVNRQEASNGIRHA